MKTSNPTYPIITVKILLAVSLIGIMPGIKSAPMTRAATITVCASGCDYSTIQAAIDAASNGDTINILAGTYTENLRIVSRELTLQGTGADVTIIDGDGTGSALHISSSVSGPSDVTILSMTIRNGSAMTDTYELGGGIYSSGSNVTLTDIVINNNIATAGGGIYSDGFSTLTMVNVTIRNNIATGVYGGGGIHSNAQRL